MARRGRKPSGANLVEHLDGSERAKARLKAILETLSGERSIPEVCEELGIQESMFHRVRSEVLQTALSRLEPRPLGRPPQTPSPGDERMTELEEENLRLQTELQASEVRRELAEKLPRLAKPPTTPGKKTTNKTTAREWKRHRKRLQRNMNRPQP
jgi:hypothetical protein